MPPGASGLLPLFLLLPDVILVIRGLHSGFVPQPELPEVWRDKEGVNLDYLQWWIRACGYVLHEGCDKDPEQTK